MKNKNFFGYKMELTEENVEFPNSKLWEGLDIPIIPDDLQNGVIPLSEFWNLRSREESNNTNFLKFFNQTNHEFDKRQCFVLSSSHHHSPKLAASQTEIKIREKIIKDGYIIGK